jgi:hypothetical protein
MAIDRSLSPSVRGWPHHLGYPVSLRDVQFPQPQRWHPDDFYFSRRRLVRCGLFMMGGELLTKYSRSDDDDKSI